MIKIKAAKAAFLFEQLDKFFNSRNMISGSSKNRSLTKNRGIGMGNRNRWEIWAEILELAKKGTLKTTIMWRCRLSFKQLNNYLRELNDSGFIEKKEQNGKEVIKTTKKGKEFQKEFQALKQLMA